MQNKWYSILSYLRKNQPYFKLTKRTLWTKLAIASGVVGFGVVSIALPVHASDLQAHPAKLPWPHNGIISSYDHAAVRRGYQVYKEVCSACHSLRYLCYRHLVNEVLTEAEAKEDAAEHMYPDGPDDSGKMFERPGRLTDLLPEPYENSQAARVANNGAEPPDLTYIVKARHGNEDYIFHLLTGYMDPPPGRTVPDGQYYNPYFPGGALSMARVLYDDLVEYPDGTPATTSQMAKDVASFLCWTSDRNHDERKRVLSKAALVTGMLAIIAGIYKRKRWSDIKTRKVIYKNRPIPKDV
uniref:Cytochrome c domain-containing protein n=1 Tax=Trichobilharzia regenti TaxID=157069 RepID=A0AA85IUL9_TRIRE|nr:unnamed protein product [Trichobilharzia regenti]